MSSPPRDKDATWRSLSTHCRALGWSKPRAVYELQNGLPYRTIPPGHEHEIDWHRWEDQHNLNVETGELSLVGLDFLTVGIEVLAPPDVVPERKPRPKRRPKRKPAKKVSLAAVERCFRDIMSERPDDPLNEEDMLAEMKERLGASPGRPRVRDMWKRIAPEWKRPVGHPRNKISAKNSAT